MASDCSSSEDATIKKKVENFSLLSLYLSEGERERRREVDTTP